MEIARSNDGAAASLRSAPPRLVWRRRSMHLQAGRKWLRILGGAAGQRPGPMTIDGGDKSRSVQATIRHIVHTSVGGRKYGAFECIWLPAIERGCSRVALATQFIREPQAHQRTRASIVIPASASRAAMRGLDVRQADLAVQFERSPLPTAREDDASTPISRSRAAYRRHQFAGCDGDLLDFTCGPCCHGTRSPRWWRWRFPHAGRGLVAQRGPGRGPNFPVRTTPIRCGRASR